MSTQSKAEALEKLKREMEADNLPLKGDAHLIFGEGNIDAEVMCIGEAPGFHEDRLVRPFVGRSGQLLDKLLQGIGWPRERVYITNIVKRRPPENRDPSPEEIEAYKPYLSRQIALINPKIIATLGRFSMAYFLPGGKISLNHGRAVNVNAHTVFPLYHPAAALRSAAMLKALEEDFKNLAVLIAQLAKSEQKQKEEIQAPEQTALF